MTHVVLWSPRSVLSMHGVGVLLVLHDALLVVRCRVAVLLLLCCSYSSRSRGLVVVVVW